MRKPIVIAAVGVMVALVGAQQPNPRQQPGAPITLYAPEQHDLYDGRFILSAGRVHMVGDLHSEAGWDHIDNAAASVRLVEGTAVTW